MIASVTFEKTLYNQVPYKFEAGTPNIAGVVGLRRGDRLPVGDRSRRRARARGRGAGVRDRAGARDSRRAHHRRGAPQDRRAVVRDRGRASARRRHDPRPAGRRRAHRPALRAAGDGPFGIPATIRASLGDLQHARGHRRAGRGLHKVREVFAYGRVRLRPQRRQMSELNDLYQEVILDHNRRPRNFRAIERADREAGGLQPALRRSADAVSSRSTAT